MDHTTKNLSCRVPIDVAKRLEKLSVELDVSMSKIMGISLNAGMDQVEGVKNSVLWRAALKLAEHLEPSAAVREELREINQALNDKQSDKLPKLFRELGRE